MKKLKLKALELGAKEVLTREQLKNVLGGDGGSGSGGTYCTVSCDGSVGQWSYTSMPTCSGIMTDVGDYCRSGEGTMHPGCQCTM